MTLNIPDTGSKRVIVVGGGFGGLQLVKKLSRSGYQIVLVDRNNFHMFQPLLYQVATAAINPGDISFPFRKLFRGKRDVFFRMAEVLRVDPDKNRIYTDRGDLGYDYLVMATGSTTNYFGMDSIEKQAYSMKEVSEALAIRNRVLLHVEKAVELPSSELKSSMLNIVIVGGGATGVELAGAFAEMKNNIMPKDYPEYHRNDINIYLIEGAPKLLGNMHERTSRKARQYLEDIGVEVMLNGMVTDYRDGSVILKDGREIPTHNLIWTSGVTVKMPEGLDRFPRGRGGRMLTDMYFRLKGSDNIFAIGDASIQTDDPENPNGYPQLARVAMEQAAHLGRNLKRLLKGKLPEKFDYREYPVLATVGRNHAFAEYRKFWVGGFFAWLAWAGIHLFLILGVKNKLNIFMGWIWNYLTYDLPTRVVIIPHTGNERNPDALPQTAAKTAETPPVNKKENIAPKDIQPRNGSSVKTGQQDRSERGNVKKTSAGIAAAQTVKGTQQVASGAAKPTTAKNKHPTVSAADKPRQSNAVKKTPAKKEKVQV